jgi:hypothetical protein
MGKSQESQQLAVGMSGKWGLETTAPIMAFSLEEGTRFYGQIYFSTPSIPYKPAEE